MPIDPSISLGVKVPDMLGTIKSYADVQNTLNQNKLFQQTFSARQRAGQILSQAPDMETGLAELYKDPVTAPFAGETVNQVRQGQQTLADIQLKHQQAETSSAEAGKIGTEQAKLGQEMSSSGLQGALAHGLPAIIDNPSEATWNNVMAGQLKGLSPQAQRAVAPALDLVKQSLLSDLPDDPVGRVDTVKRRAAALALGSGFTPEALAGIAGKPIEVNQGNVITGGVQAPALAGGGISSAGQQFPVGHAAGYETGPGSVPFPVPGVPGTPVTSASNALVGSSAPTMPAGSNALGANQPSTAQVGGQAGGQVGGQGTGNVPEPQQAVAYTGRPLFDQHTPMLAPRVGTGAGGLPLLSSAQQKNADKLQEDFADSGLRAFNNANTTLGSLDSMSHDLDQLAKTGGLLTPGTASQFRADVAKGINTLADSVGLKQPFDPKSLASVEAFNKETNRMGLTVLTTMLGNQREAAQTINNITTKAVPGIDNTYMGGKLVIEGLKAATQRAIDQRNWENEWQRRNQGNLNGADEAFNARFPAKDYAEAALAKFGLTGKGFVSPEAVGEAVRAGYMTKAQGIDVLHNQFPDQFKP